MRRFEVELAADHGMNKVRSQRTAQAANRNRPDSGIVRMGVKFTPWLSSLNAQLASLNRSIYRP